jgi:guanylate kinase
MTVTKVKNKKTIQKLGNLFVISAPSGAGKTTLCQKLLKNMPDMKLSVSYTTREPRKGEVNDVDYTFVTREKFKKMIEREEFAEWATVHGNLYGTSIKRLKDLNNEGYDIILDIDIHGATQLRKSYDGAFYIFVLPPSMEALGKRLVNRKTDSDEIIRNRLDNAKAEISQYENYDYIIINDRIDKAYKELESIVLSAGLRTECADHKWIKQIINYKEDVWI